MKSFLIGLGVLVFAVTFALIWGITLSNSEIDIKTKGLAQQKNCTAYFDKMWKVLQQDASVADQYKEAFKEIYVPLIEGRYAKGDGTLMKWIQESNPTFSTESYTKLMTAIEGQREGFFIEQQKLIDIDREHKRMRQSFPNSMIIGKRPDLNIVVITSARTNDANSTGQDNDVDLFKKTK